MILLTNSKIENEIIKHFDKNYEPDLIDYECVFKFDGAEIIVPYSIDGTIYKNEHISAEKGGASYCIEDRDHFSIRRMTQNPKDDSIGKRIQDVIDEKESEAEEDKEIIKAIEAHNDWMHLNNR